LTKEEYQRLVGVVVATAALIENLTGEMSDAQLVDVERHVCVAVIFGLELALPDTATHREEVFHAYKEIRETCRKLIKASGEAVDDSGYPKGPQFPPMESLERGP